MIFGIIHSGWSVDAFRNQAISTPYIFVMAAEILAEAIRSNKNIEVINIYKQEHKVSQYADDTTLITKANETSIKTSMSTLKEFERISGLRIKKQRSSKSEGGEATG